jgi:hypothetical protein
MSLLSRLSKKNKTKSGNDNISDKLSDKLSGKLYHSKSEVALQPQNTLSTSGLLYPVPPATYIIRSPMNNIYIAVKHATTDNDIFTIMSDIHPDIVKINLDWRIAPFDFNLVKRLYDVDSRQFMHSDGSIEWLYVLPLRSKQIILSGRDAGRILSDTPVYYDPNSY